MLQVSSDNVIWIAPRDVDGTPVEPTDVSVEATVLPEGTDLEVVETHSWDPTHENDDGTAGALQVIIDASTELPLRKRVSLSVKGDVAGADLHWVREFLIVEDGYTPTGALISLSQALHYIVGMGTAEPDPFDVELELAAASDSVREYKHRRFTCPTVDEVRTIALLGDKTIYPDELLEITAVSDLDGNAVVYEIMPGEREGEHVRWLTVDTDAAGVRIEGTWGWREIPEGLKRVMRLIVRDWYRRNYMAETRLAADAGYTRPSGIPAEARYILDDAYSLTSP